METHVIVYQEYFACTLEEITKIVYLYICALVSHRPEAEMDAILLSVKFSIP